MKKIGSAQMGRWMLVAVVNAMFLGSACAADAASAEKLAKASGCTKCHGAEKGKDGPAYRDVAAKYRDLPDRESKLIHHITSGEKVKFADGHKEDHKKVKSTDEGEIKNLIGWILELPGGTKY